LREPDGVAVTTVLYFDQSLRGLSAGAPVDFRGIVMGEVRSVGVEFDPVKKTFRMPVTVDMYPARLGRNFAQRWRRISSAMPARRCWNGWWRAACAASCAPGIC